MAIAFVQSGSAAGNSVTSVTVTLPAASTTGNTLVVLIAHRTTSNTLSTVSDSSGLNSYFQQVTNANTGNTAGLELWTVVNANSASSVSVTVQASEKFVVIVAEYSGVGSVGVTAVASGSSNAPGVTGTVSAASSWWIFGAANQGTATSSTNFGNLRTSIHSSGGSAASNEGGALGDNTGSTSDTVATTLSTSEQWVAAGIELIGGNHPSLTASDTDSFSESLTRGVVIQRAVADSSTFSESNATSTGIKLRGTTNGPNTNGLSTTLSLPTGTTTGDVTLIAIASQVNTATFTFPAGWTALSNGGGFAVFYRAFQTGDSTSISISASATGWLTSGAISYSGCDTASPIDASGFTIISPSHSNNSALGQYHSPSLNPSFNNSKLVAVFMCDTIGATAITNPTGFTSRLSNAPGPNLLISDKGLTDGTPSNNARTTSGASLSSKYGLQVALKASGATAATKASPYPVLGGFSSPTTSVSENNGTNFTVDFTSLNPQDGDIVLIAMPVANSGATATSLTAVTTGYTQLDGSNFGYLVTHNWVAGDTTAPAFQVTTTGGSTAPWVSLQIVLIRKCGGSTNNPSIDQHAMTTAVASANSTSSALTPSTSNDLQCVWWTQDTIVTNAWTPPASGITIDNNDSSGPGVLFGWVYPAASPSATLVATNGDPTHCFTVLFSIVAGNHPSLAASDTGSFSESLAKGMAFQRAFSDTLSFSDTVSQHRSISRSVNADSFTFGESNTALKGVGRTASDSFTFTENSVNRAVALSRALTEAAGSFSEQLARAAQLSRALSDTESFSEALQTSKGVSRSASDTESFSESLLHQKGVGRTVSDTFSLSETLTRGAMSFSRSVSDALSFSESVARSMAAHRALTEALSFTESILKGVGANRTATDTASFGESLSRRIGNSRTITDVLTFNESLSRLVQLTKALSDTLTMSDTATASNNHFISLTATDSFTLSESMSRLLSLHVALTDALTSSESLSRGTGSSRTASDTESFVESLARSVGRHLSASDTSTFAETLARGLQLHRSPSDNFVLSESTARLVAIHLAVSEALSLTESLTAMASGAGVMVVANLAILIGILVSTAAAIEASLVASTAITQGATVTTASAPQAAVVGTAQNVEGAAVSSAEVIEGAAITTVNIED